MARFVRTYVGSVVKIPKKKFTLFIVSIPVLAGIFSTEKKRRMIYL